MKPLIKTAIATAIAAASSAAIAATDCNARHDEHNISYNYVSSNPGDVVTINDVDYRIIRMPFVEFGSDKKFYVQFPVSVKDYGYERFTLTTNHDISAPEGCINLEMAGERVNVQLPSTVEDTRYISTNSTKLHIFGSTVDTYEVKFHSSLQSAVKIAFRVGETRLSVGIGGAVVEQNEKTRTAQQYDSTPYDFTDNFDYNKMIDGASTQAVDDLMDYVTIGTF